MLGLHEPARRADAEEVQAVLDAATDEPTVAVVAVEVGTDRNAGEVREVGTGRSGRPSNRR